MSFRSAELNRLLMILFALAGIGIVAIIVLVIKLIVSFMEVAYNWDFFHIMAIDC